MVYAPSTPTLLFLCTGNSCRSQMAEAWLNFYYPSQFKVFSAGIEAHGMNPSAVHVMQEKGVDMSHHQSKTIEDLPTVEFDYVVSVCHHAQHNCPNLKATKKNISRIFDDPPYLADMFSDEEDKINCYRFTRDNIEIFCKNINLFI
jgi:arsenate reductase (thioredoxin)